MKTIITWKLDCRSIFNIAIATTIALSYRVNFAAACLGKDTTVKIDRFSGAPIALQVQNPSVEPNNSNPIIEQRETTGANRQPDLNLFKRSVQTFFQSNRIQSKSNMTFDFSASGVKGQINVNITTVAETGSKFNSQVIFTNSQSIPMKFNIISNGKKVWVYRPDKRVYRETSLAKFEKERYWVGIAAAWFSAIAEKDRLKLLNNNDSTFDRDLSTALKSPQFKEFRGNSLLVNDRFLYAFSNSFRDSGKLTAIVQPDTGELVQLEMSGMSNDVKILFKEKIESWERITSIDKKTFIFSPPKGVKRVETLSIMPFGK
jgi:outer membrane lipoprotein-sorting protein